MTVTSVKESQNSSDLFLSLMLDFSSPFCVTCEVLDILQKVPHMLQYHSFRSWRNSIWILHVPSCRIISCWCGGCQYTIILLYFSWVKIPSRRPTIQTRRTLTWLQYLLGAVSSTASSWPQKGFHLFWKHGGNVMYDNTWEPVRAGWPEGSSEKSSTYFWNHGRGKLYLDIHDTTVNNHVIPLRYNLVGDGLSCFTATTCRIEL